MHKRIWRTKKRKKTLPYSSSQSMSPESWRGEGLAGLGRGAGSGTAAALRLLLSSAAICLLRGTTLEASHSNSPWGCHTACHTPKCPWEVRQS